MKLSAFLPDIRLVCPGMPEPWQYRFLTRSLQQFLSQTQVWQEWTAYSYDFTAASKGLIVVPHAQYNPAAPATTATAYTDRVLRVKWMPNGRTLEQVDMLQVDDEWPTWMTDTNREPRCWFPRPTGFAGSPAIAVQLLPFPATVADDTAGALRFYVSHTVAEVDTPEQVFMLDETLGNSGVADWIGRRYRETIVAGALAKALITPGVDWADASLAGPFAAAFAQGIDEARSEAEAGQAARSGTVRYGGY